MRGTAHVDHRAAIAAGIDVISVVAAIRAAREAMAVFVEKRRPKW
jgi:hypothetical protein